MTTPSRILITNGTVVSVDPELGELTGADVLVVDGRIEEIGVGLSVENCEVIDATDMIVMPGFVDSHRHIWQAAIRNIGSDWTHGQYLTGIHLGLSKLFRPQDTYIGNLLGTLEALDGGITTILDWSHNIDTPDHADAAVSALLESGSRAIFAHGGGATMWNLPSNVPHSRDVLRIRDQYFSSADQLVTMAFAMRGPQFSTPETATEDFKLAQELGTRITIHNGDGEWGKSRPVAWMHEHGMLSELVTHVHCCSLATDELAMIADSGGSASVSADVEAQMGLGWPATGRLLEAGIRPSLSIDVCASNGSSMFNAMKATIGIQRGLDNAAEEHAGEQAGLKLTCQDVIEFATIEGARAVGLGDQVGSLTPGKQADIILVRADDLSMTPLNNPTGQLVYNAHAGMVDTVLVAGKVVKRAGELVGVDTARIRRLATETRDYLFEQAKNDPNISDAALGGRWIPGIHKVNR